MTVSEHDHIRRTLADFCHVTDSGDFEAWVNLFTDDGEFHLLGQTFRGAQALREFIAQDQPPERRGVHLTTDSQINVDGGVAQAISKFVFIASTADGPLVVTGGTYHDELVRAADRWLFHSRECVLALAPRASGWGTDSPAPGETPWWAVTRATIQRSQR